MNFNYHGDLVGQHAFLSGSKYHWINYDVERLRSSYLKYLAVKRGTDLHELAKQCILLGVKLPKTKNALNMYVNDAIGFRMIPEQILFYTFNAFGTVDAISFRKNFLRIHDLKTGVTPVYIHQLEVYAALFCLEYDHLPENIEIELRIYQGTEIYIHTPETKYIKNLMDKIIYFDKEIEKMKLGEL